MTSMNSPSAPQKPKLLDRVRWAIRSRHYSRNTEDAYVAWIKRFIFFHGKRHPMEMGAPEIIRFLSFLAVEGKVSASTQNQALSALLFLYKEVLDQPLPWLDNIAPAKRPVRLPVVLSRDEVQAILAHLHGTSRLMGTFLYGAGLRVLECCRLRVKDVDFAAKQIVVRNGKGDKDRVTLLPGVAASDLARHLEAVHVQHQRDGGRGAGWVELPGALGRKYPNAGREWGWQWVFPATRFYRDPETGQRRRHHLHESVLQRAVKEAVRRAGVAKPASPHTFRHSGVYPAFMRDHSSPRRRLRHSDCPRTPGAQGRQHDHDLHACSQPGAGSRPQPSGPPLRHRRRRSAPGSRSPCRPDMLRALAA